MFCTRVGVVLDFVRRSGTTRAEGAHRGGGTLHVRRSKQNRLGRLSLRVRGAKRNRLDRHSWAIERLPPQGRVAPNGATGAILAGTKVTGVSGDRVTLSQFVYEDGHAQGSATRGKLKFKTAT